MKTKDANKPKFRIRFESGLKEPVFLALNIPAAKLQREGLFEAGLSSDLWAPGASRDYKPSNKFYQTQYEYHGRYE